MKPPGLVKQLGKQQLLVVDSQKRSTVVIPLAPPNNKAVCAVRAELADFCRDFRSVAFFAADGLMALVIAQGYSCSHAIEDIPHHPDPIDCAGTMNNLMKALCVIKNHAGLKTAANLFNPVPGFRTTSDGQLSFPLITTEVTHHIPAIIRPVQCSTARGRSATIRQLSVARKIKVDDFRLTGKIRHGGRNIRPSGCTLVSALCLFRCTRQPVCSKMARNQVMIPAELFFCFSFSLSKLSCGACSDFRSRQSAGDSRMMFGFGVNRYINMAICIIPSAYLWSCDTEARIDPQMRTHERRNLQVVLDLFPMEYRRLRGDLMLTYALFEQGLANRFFTVDPANTRRGHGILQLNRLHKVRVPFFSGHDIQDIEADILAITHQDWPLPVPMFLKELNTCSRIYLAEFACSMTAFFDRSGKNMANHSVSHPLLPDTKGVTGCPVTRSVLVGALLDMDEILSKSILCRSGTVMPYSLLSRAQPAYTAKWMSGAIFCLSENYSSCRSAAHDWTAKCCAIVRKVKPVDVDYADDIVFIFEDEAGARSALNKLTPILPPFGMRLGLTTYKATLQNVQSLYMSLTTQGGSLVVVEILCTPRCRNLRIPAKSQEKPSATHYLLLKASSMIKQTASMLYCQVADSDDDSELIGKRSKSSTDNVLPESVAFDDNNGDWTTEVSGVISSGVIRNRAIRLSWAALNTHQTDYYAIRKTCNIVFHNIPPKITQRTHRLQFTHGNMLSARSQMSLRLCNRSYFRKRTNSTQVRPNNLRCPQHKVQARAPDALPIGIQLSSLAAPAVVLGIVTDKLNGSNDDSVAVLVVSITYQDSIVRTITSTIGIVNRALSMIWFYTSKETHGLDKAVQRHRSWQTSFFYGPRAFTGVLSMPSNHVLLRLCIESQLTPDDIGIIFQSSCEYETNRPAVTEEHNDRRFIISSHPSLCGPSPCTLEWFFKWICDNQVFEQNNCTWIDIGEISEVPSGVCVFDNLAHNEGENQTNRIRKNLLLFVEKRSYVWSLTLKVGQLNQTQLLALIKREVSFALVALRSPARTHNVVSLYTKYRSIECLEQSLQKQPLKTQGCK
ncbi:hypothetical protein CLF_107359 [Clonorchis sinensis]|uniref:Uncharacterized protein n=1 Tax=Clonorchis sinensis TaxID=79923 RepID=G7YGM8_CLOSI|nr:hypothetical protein CLF_107359 [Clonorchis sinensis]